MTLKEKAAHSYSLRAIGSTAIIKAHMAGYDKALQELREEADRRGREDELTYQFGNIIDYISR